MDRKRPVGFRSISNPEANRKFPGRSRLEIFCRKDIILRALWKFPVHFRSDPGGQFPGVFRSEDRKFQIGFRSESGQNMVAGVKGS
jgi:hypothetical protein